MLERFGLSSHYVPFGVTTSIALTADLRVDNVQSGLAGEVLQILETSKSKVPEQARSPLWQLIQHLPSNLM